MEKITLVDIIGNIRKNYLILLSGTAALCLFLIPWLLSLALVIMLFALILLAVAFDVARPPVLQTRFSRVISVCLTLLIAVIAFVTFVVGWTPSHTVEELAGDLGISNRTLLYVVGVFGCFVGLYALNTLSCWIVFVSSGVLPALRICGDVAHLKRNWFFPVSALAFFGLNVQLTPSFFTGLVIALMAAVMIAYCFPSLWTLSQNNSVILRAISIVTAMGVSVGCRDYFVRNFCLSTSLQALEERLPLHLDIPECLGWAGAVVSLFFIYLCILAFWNCVNISILKLRAFSNIRISEWLIYALLVLLSISFMVLTFARSDAFYGFDNAYDIIYTSDSARLVGRNAYLVLTHAENDLRQPLFAVFASPFVGIPYLISKLVGASESVHAMLVNAVQIIMLYAAHLMLARIMKLGTLKRICFMVLTSCTYMHMLFILMMEQYIIGYFWLVFCLYIFAEKQTARSFALWGAGGTLLTSLILLPWIPGSSPVRNVRAWLYEVLKSGLMFVVFMLVFCRFDVIFNAMERVSFLVGFTGHNVAFADKVCQYTSFIRTCFVAPHAGVHCVASDLFSWRLDAVTGLNYVGIVIVALSVVSTIWNRNKASSLIAFGWVVFSVALLLVLGWGTAENGLILYSLYFGWAFLVLLFQLVEKMESTFNTCFLIPAATIVIAVLLMTINVPAMMKMIHFAITYYPV